MHIHIFICIGPIAYHIHKMNLKKRKLVKRTKKIDSQITKKGHFAKSNSQIT